MRSYRRVTYEDRCQIRAFLQVKLSKPEISIRLGFHKSTIYREIARNSERVHGYRPGSAHNQWLKRIRNCRRPERIKEELEVYVVNRLMENWSPEQICGRLRVESGVHLTHPTVYRFVYRHWSVFKNCLRRYNRRGAGRLIQRRCKRAIGPNISLRPQVANQRLRTGDWERDCFLVAKRKQFLVCTDRRSRFTRISKIPQVNARSLSRLTWRILKSTGKQIHTITNDNGTEFNDGPNMKVPVYYCTPYRPQQRGTIENTIGLIRYYIKRTVSQEEIHPDYIKMVEKRLNLRPRKILDYKTPYEVFYGKTVALAI